MARRKRNSKFQTIPFAAEIDLATLAKDAVLATALITFGEEAFCISADTIWTVEDATEGEGPISVGWNHGDLSVTEIAEALAAEQADRDDIIANERARRPVRRVGSFDLDETHQTLQSGDRISVNHDHPNRDRIRIRVGSGHSLQFWAKQDGQNANLTTGLRLGVQGNLYVVWI